MTMATERFLATPTEALLTCRARDNIAAGDFDDTYAARGTPLGVLPDLPQGGTQVVWKQLELFRLPTRLGGMIRPRAREAKHGVALGAIHSKASAV